MKADDQELRHEDERRAAAALSTLRRALPDPGYRERLKREFVSARLASPVPIGRPGRGARPWIAGRGLLWLPAAAALLVVAGAAGLNRGPTWEVGAIGADGIVVVDGRPIPLRHAEQLGRALRGGATLRLSAAGPLEVVAPGQILIQITPGTVTTLPSTAGRWFGRSVRARVESGEIRITTAERFRGARLGIGTPEAEIEVAGTTLAVIREPEGTCVCVMEGTVRIGRPGEPMSVIPAGRRRFVFSDGSPAEWDDMLPEEHRPLDELRRRMRESSAAE